MTSAPAAHLGAALAVVNGGYMLADGLHRLASGSYFGRDLGPWAFIVRAAGIDPRSPLMACIFIAFGIAWLVAAALWLRGKGTTFVTLLAVLTLWYASFGTIVALAELVLARAARGTRRDVSGSSPGRNG